MSRSLVKLVVGIAALMLLLPGTLPAQGPVKLNVSQQPEFESFLTWQAIQDGTQKKYIPE